MALARLKELKEKQTKLYLSLPKTTAGFGEVTVNTSPETQAENTRIYEAFTELAFKHHEKLTEDVQKVNSGEITLPEDGIQALITEFQALQKISAEMLRKYEIMTITKEMNIDITNNLSPEQAVLLHQFFTAGELKNIKPTLVCGAFCFHRDTVFTISPQFFIISRKTKKYIDDTQEITYIVENNVAGAREVVGQLEHQGDKMVYKRITDKSSIINIDFNNLTDQQAALLHQFFSEYEPKKTETIFTAGTHYSYRGYTFIFSNNFFRRTKKHTNGTEEFIYTFYRDSNSKEKAAFARAYGAEAELTHQDGKIVYKKRMDSAFNIDFNKLTEEQSRFLHQFFSEHEKVTKEFKPGSTYFSNQLGNVIFGRTIVRRTKKREDGSKEYIYTVYKEEAGNIKGEGASGVVYVVEGQLKHQDGKMTYKAIDGSNNPLKRKVIKKQILAKDPEALSSPEFVMCGNEIGRAVPYTKTKKVTFIKNGDGVKTVSYEVLREFPGKTLDKIVNHLSLEQAMQLSLNLLVALGELHNRYGVIHRDLKPKNIFVDENDNMAVYIFDFDVSRWLNKPDGKYPGTHGYIAPEVKAESPDCDKRGDFFSIGIVLREIWDDEVMREYYNAFYNYNDDEYNKIVNRLAGLDPKNLGQVPQYSPLMSSSLLSKLSAYGKTFVEDLKGCLTSLTLFNKEKRISLAEAIILFTQWNEMVSKPPAESLEPGQATRNKNDDKPSAAIGPFFSSGQRQAPGQPQPRQQHYFDEPKDARRRAPGRRMSQ